MVKSTMSSTLVSLLLLLIVSCFFNLTTAAETALETPSQGEYGESARDVCDLQSVDAALSHGYYLYLFKDKFFWRMDNGRTVKSGPFNISSRYSRGPATVDAIYQRPQDRKTYVFNGNQFYVYNRDVYVAGPTSISELGLNVDRVDGILNWWRSRYRRHTYFFVGNKYYRRNERKQVSERGYPKSNRVWDSRFSNIDAVMPNAMSKRRSIFFKGGQVYAYNNYEMDIEGVASLSAWLNCNSKKKAIMP